MEEGFEQLRAKKEYTPSQYSAPSRMTSVFTNVWQETNTEKLPAEPGLCWEVSLLCLTYALFTRKVRLHLR